MEDNYTSNNYFTLNTPSKYEDLRIELVLDNVNGLTVSLFEEIKDDQGSTITREWIDSDSIPFKTLKQWITNTDVINDYK